MAGGFSRVISCRGLILFILLCFENIILLFTLIRQQSIFTLVASSPQPKMSFNKKKQDQVGGGKEGGHKGSLPDL